MKKNIKLYNVIFPIWLLILFPPIILIVLSGNFIIDSIVLLICLKLLKLNVKENYKKSIIKVWLLGFLADIIGTIPLFSALALPEKFSNIMEAVVWNPYQNIFGIIFVVCGILLAGACIYLFNKNISFKKLDIEEKNKKILSLILAIFTMPYLFLLPTSAIYKEMEGEETQPNKFEILEEYVEDFNGTYLGDAPNMTKSFMAATDAVNSELEIETSEYPYEIKAEESKFVINIKNADVALYEKDLKNISLLLMVTSDNTKVVEYKTEDGKTVAYNEDDLEKEFAISLEELAKVENKGTLEKIILGEENPEKTEFESNCIYGKITKIESNKNIITLTIETYEKNIAYINVEEKTEILNAEKTDLKVGDNLKIKLPEQIKEIYPMNEVAIEIEIIK